MLTVAFQIIGASVVFVCGVWLAIRAARWLRLYVLRSTGLRFSLPMNATRAMSDLKRIGWDMKLVGFGSRRWQLGVLYGSPPIYECERCHKRFRTEDECIEHEEAYGHAPA